MLPLKRYGPELGMMREDASGQWVRYSDYAMLADAVAPDFDQSEALRQIDAKDRELVRLRAICNRLRVALGVFGRHLTPTCDDLACDCGYRAEIGAWPFPQTETQQRHPDREPDLIDICNEAMDLLAGATHVVRDEEPTVTAEQISELYERYRKAVIRAKSVQP